MDEVKDKVADESSPVPAVVSVGEPVSVSWQRSIVQLALMLVGLAALAILGCPWFKFDDASRSQIISLLGALAAAAGASGARQMIR